MARSCPICCISIEHLPVGRVTCSMACVCKLRSHRMKTNNPTMRPEIAARIQAGRIASGGEKRRIEKLKRAHRDGRFAGQKEWMRKNAGTRCHPPIAKYCKECGKLVSPTTRNSRIYCSRVCEKISKKRQLEERWSLVRRYCLNCNQQMRPKVGKRGHYWFTKTCSDACFRQLSSKMKKGDMHPMRKMSDVDKAKWFAKTLAKGMTTECPNKFERRVIEFFKANNLPFYFTGDGSFWVSRCKSGQSRNPDFLCKKSFGRKVVLAHGTYWHRDPLLVQIELDDYQSRGWTPFIIWEHDILDETMAGRVRDFLENSYE